MSDLTKNEEILLLSIWRLGESAYGVRIKEQIRKVIGKDWNYGTLYCTLDQMVKKDLLIKKEGKPLPERGGRRKIYYSLSKNGVKALHAAYFQQKALWNGITDVVIGRMGS